MSIAVGTDPAKNEQPVSPKLKANPFSTVTIRYSGGEPLELRVWSVTKSRRAMTRNLSRGGRADFDRICKIATQVNAPNRAATAPSIGEYMVLAALGLWAPETDLIDPILLETPLRSGSAASRGQWPAQDFALRGEVWLQHGPEPCRPARDIPLDCLAHARPILWHKGSDFEPLLPWWPDAGCVAAVEAVQRGGPLHRNLLPALAALAEQSILVRRTGEQAGQARPGLDLAAARAAFARDGFVNLGQLLPPGQLAAFQTYWRKLAELDLFPQRGDKRHGSHGEPSTMLLLQLMKPLIEHLIGASVEPAFTYSWFYDRGTEMPPHRDRMESSYTVTFLVDYAPALDGPTPWPLFVVPRGGSSPVEIRQTVGDALLFCGGELEHSRPPFTMGDRSTSLLLHYADQGYSGALF